jgi:hypothetical protein
MSNNAFSKEEIVAFDQVLEGFDDALVLSRNISKYTTDQTMMERTGDVIWRPMPYIAQTFDGSDQTNNFVGQTQLTVPSTIGYEKSSPLILTATELRDALQENRLGRAAMQKLASDVNRAVMDVASAQGTLYVKRTAAATGFDDVAQCEAIFNETGVMSSDRYLALSTRDYNGMANNLQGLSRSFGNAKSDRAFEQAFVGPVASFNTYKLDYANRQTAAAGGGAITLSTLAAGGNVYVPRATSTASTGQRNNVDNRYQTITVTSTTNVRAGDAFTIATVEAVHLITKQSTGQLKTFRVIEVPAGGTTLVISPPIISAQGGTDAELQYQNCVVNTPASNSAIVWLNTVAAAINPFWHKDSIELLPGRYAVPANAGAAVMRTTTDQGIEVTMTKQFDINTLKTKFRWDIRFGVVLTQPEMVGLMTFSQT